jgi:hypothetical protein
MDFDFSELPPLQLGTETAAFNYGREILRPAVATLKPASAVTSPRASHRGITEDDWQGIQSM